MPKKLGIAAIAKRALQYADPAIKGDVKKLAQMALSDAPSVARYAISKAKRKKGKKKKNGNGGSTMSTRSVSAPLAQGTVIKGKSSMPRMSGSGKQMVMSGTQFVCDVGLNASSNYIFGGFAINNTYNTTARLGLNPLCMGGRLAELAALYTKYMFTNVRFDYVPITATTQTGNLSFGYSSDPNIAYSQSASTAKVLQINPNYSGPFYVKGSLSTVPKRSDDLFLINTNVSSSADKGVDYFASIQGALTGISTTAGPSGGLQLGILMISYTIVFDTPIASDSKSSLLFAPLTEVGFSITEPEAKGYTVLVNPHDDLVIVPDHHAVVGYVRDSVVSRVAANVRKDSFLDLMMTYWKPLVTGLSRAAASAYVASYVPVGASERAVAVGSWLPSLP